MALYGPVLHTPLRQLRFSHECLRWFEDAGVRTIEDTEEDITLLMRSKYFKQELLREMIHVITLYCAAQKIKADEERKAYLVSLRRKKKPYWYRLVRMWVRKLMG